LKAAKEEKSTRSAGRLFHTLITRILKYDAPRSQMTSAPLTQIPRRRKPQFNDDEKQHNEEEKTNTMRRNDRTKYTENSSIMPMG